MRRSTTKTNPSPRRWPDLLSALKNLPAVGPGGFEGLVRDALQEVTQQSMRLIKSGPQHGADAMTLGNAPVVLGVEAKRYDKTPLELDEVKAKLLDAAASHPDLDLWVLAATRELSKADAEQLADIGHQLGIEVVILDWSASATALPPLAVLLYLAPQTCSHHFATAPRAIADVNWLSGEASLALSTSLLRETLAGPAIGFTSTRRHVAEWTRQQLKDRSDAMLAFDSHADILATHQALMPRPILEKCLEEWWLSAKPPLMALLGEEGRGKTWGALSWWLGRIDEPDAPLFVYLKGANLVGSDGPPQVAEHMNRILPGRTTAFWQKRLNRWAASGRSDARLLVVVDGLNQHGNYSAWTELFLSFHQSLWRSFAKVLCTTRPDHWQSSARQLAGLTGVMDICSHGVGSLDDHELDAWLAPHQLQKKDFGPALLQLLRIPRLFRLAMERRQVLKDAGDITAERLIYEDWKSRHFRTTNQLSDEEFRDVIAGIGRELHLKPKSALELTRRDLLERLTAENGSAPQEMRGAFSDLVDGGWLTPKASNRFVIHADRVPAVLGTALLLAVFDVDDRAKLDEVIAVHLEPYGGSAIAIGIARCATVFAHLHPRVTPTGRLALLRAWLKMQNFDGVDFEALWRLGVGIFPTLLLFTDEAWRRGTTRAYVSEVIVKSVANAWQWPEVRGMVEMRLYEWLRSYWLDPRAGEGTGTPRNAETALRETQTLERANLWASTPQLAQLTRVSVQQVAEEEARLGRNAVGLMSWLPLSELTRPILACAITHALMGSHRQRDDLRWILRTNRKDFEETFTALNSFIDELRASGYPLAIDVASELATALGIETARGMQPVEAEQGSQVQRVHSAVTAPGKHLEDVELQEARALDPGYTADASTLEGLHAFFANRTDDAIRQSDACETARAAAGHAWAPGAVIEHERRAWHLALVDSLSEPTSDPAAPKDPEPVVDGTLRRAVVLTTAESRKTLRAGLAHWRNANNAPTLLGPALLGLSVAAQISLLRSALPLEADHWDDIEAVLSTPQSEDYHRLAELLIEDPGKWLEYLFRIDLHHFPSCWAVLTTQFDAPATELRAAAFRIALASGRVDFADHLAATAWCSTRARSPHENLFGSLLLVQSTLAKTASVADRVHPFVLGHLVEKYPGRNDYIDAFETFVLSELLLLASAKELEFPRGLGGTVRGIPALAAARPTALAEAVERVMADKRNLAFLLALGNYPLLDTIVCLATVELERVAGWLSQSIDRHESDTLKSDFLLHACAPMPGLAGDGLRRRLLDATSSDYELFCFVRTIEGSAEPWLRECIERDIGDVALFTRARARVLAGFLRNNDEALALWAIIDSESSKNTWLDAVARTARQHFNKGDWNRVWFKRFSEATDIDQAFAALELFHRTADLRSNRHARLSEARKTWTPEQRWLWSQGQERTIAFSKRISDQLKRTLFFQPIPRSPHRLASNS